MFVIKPIGLGNHSLIEAIVAGFVAADEQDRGSPRIESEKRAQRAAAMLRPQFLHVRVLRTGQGVGMRPRKTRADLSQKLDAGRNRFLLIRVERIPPLAEFVGVFDFPHRAIIAYMLYPSRLFFRA